MLEDHRSPAWSVIMPTERIALRGSERLPLANSRLVGTPDPNEFLNVTIYLRRRTAEMRPPESEPLSREEFTARYGADPADVAAVEQFAAENDLTIVAVDL